MRVFYPIFNSIYIIYQLIFFRNIWNKYKYGSLATGIKCFKLFIFFIERKKSQSFWKRFCTNSSGAIKDHRADVPRNKKELYTSRQFFLELFTSFPVYCRLTLLFIRDNLVYNVAHSITKGNFSPLGYKEIYLSLEGWSTTFLIRRCSKNDNNLMKFTRERI